VGSSIPTRRHRVIPVLIVIIAVGVAVFGWVHWRNEPTTAESTATPGYDRARTLLATLPVKGWDRHTDFSRYWFGEPWSDDVAVEFGRNGCNTRDDILRRDLRELVVRTGTCYAQTGVLLDPYTGASIPFVRGPTTSDAVQIDHIVSCPTPGTRAHASGTSNDGATSPTTRATCLPSAEKPTSTRPFAMRRHGCRPPRRFVASSSHARSR
jgi:hypothetical protein